MGYFRGIGGGLVLLMAAGCTVGPTYHPPKPTPPARWGRGGAGDAEPPPTSKLVAGAEPVPAWWTTFDDPMLTRLVKQAVPGNLDLRQARLRVIEARARREVTAGGRYPTLDASGSYIHRRISHNGIASAIGGGGEGGGEGGGRGGRPAIPGAALSEFNLFQAGFDASWELDVFGLVRRQVQTAEARYEAAVENLRGARVTLAAEVARNYLELRGLQRRLAITHENLKAQKKALDLSRSQQRAGLNSAVNVNRAAARAARTRAQLPRLRTRVQQAIHRLGVLLGRPPQALTEVLGEPEPLPTLPPRVPVGLPSTLVRRRPDIRRAERRLAAATARIGVAVARLFPRFSLTGTFGFQSTEADELAQWESRFFGIGPAVRMPIFQGGRLRATVRVRKAQRARALNQYRQTVLTALREVEDARIAYREEQTRRRSLAEAVSQNRKAVQLALDLYRQGLTDYLDVLDAQRALYQSQDELARSVQRVRTNLVALYKALGGGWKGIHAAGTSDTTITRTRAEPE